MREAEGRKGAARFGVIMMIAIAMACSVFVVSGEPAFAKAAKPGKIKASSVKRVNATETSMTVSYGKSKKASKYQVRYTLDGAKQWTTKTTKKQKITLKGLDKYTKYNIQVRGVKGKKKGAWTKAETFTTLGDEHTLTYDPGENATLPEDQATKKIRAGEAVGEFPMPTVMVGGEPVIGWFAAWFTEPFGDGEAVVETTLMGDADQTVHAVYEFDKNGNSYPAIGEAIRTKASKMYMRIVDYPRPDDYPSYALVTVLGDGSDTRVPGYLYKDHKIYYGGEISPLRLDAPMYYNSKTLYSMKSFKLPAKVKGGLLDDESYEFKQLFRPKFDVYLYAPASDPNFYVGQEKYTVGQKIQLPDGATLREDQSSIPRFNYNYAINPLGLGEVLKFTGGKLTGKKMKMLFNLKSDFDDSTNWCLRTPINASYKLKDSVSNVIDKDKLFTYQSSTDSLQVVGLEQQNNIFARPSFVVNLDHFKFYIIDGQ